jgi:hypothetical protein
MKILLYIGLALIAVIVLVVAIGYLLPQSHVASRSVVVNAPPAQVFETIARVGDHASWRTGVERVEVVSTAPLRWKEHAGGDVLTMEATSVTAPDQFVSRIADPNLPFGGTWTIDLKPEGAATRVTITEHGEVYNPIFRFMSRFVFGHTATIDAYLPALQRRHAPVTKGV